MKKVENKELTMKDLLELWDKHTQAELNSDKQKELWDNETDYNKVMLRALRTSKLTYDKVITDKLVVDDIWVNEIDLLVQGLRHYNIKEFIFKDESSQATRFIIRLLEYGYEVVGTEDWALTERHDFAEHKRYYEPRTGIVFRKKEVK